MVGIGRRTAGYRVHRSTESIQINRMPVHPRALLNAFSFNIPPKQPSTAHYRHITQSRLRVLRHPPQERLLGLTHSTSLYSTSSPGKEGEGERSAKCCESKPDERRVGLSFSASLYAIGVWVDSSMLIFASVDDNVVDEVGTALVHCAAGARVHAQFSCHSLCCTTHSC